MDGNAEDASLKLPEILDLAAAEGFYEAMRQGLESGRPLRVDASAVELLTLPCAQIILSATRSYDRLSIERPSAAFVGAFEDLGIGWNQHQDLGPEPVQNQGPKQAEEQNLDQAPQPMAAQAEMQGEGGQFNHHQTNGHTMAKRILTIDDSKTMRDMLMLTLADAGFDVLQAVDGQDGLDVLSKERVDVVITDINMPKMDGYEVIRNLRGNPSHKTTPILVLTTESETEKMNLARDAGATGWMVKPFDPDRLVATVRKVAP